MITLFISIKLAFINDPRTLPRNQPDCIIAYICVFNNFQTADELFAKSLQILETYLLVWNNSYGKLVSSFVQLIILCYIFKVRLLVFFVGDFDLLKFLVAVFNKDEGAAFNNKQKDDMLL